MNALVSFNSDISGAKNVTPAQRRAAIEQVWANTLSTQYSLQKSQAVKANQTQSVSDAAKTSTTNSTKSSKSTTASQEMGKDVFLQLLVEQMQYQDPLDPVDNKDMIAQLAQFSSLEQMNNMNDSLTAFIESMQQQSIVGASGLIGKTISGVDANGEEVEGVVDKVFASSGKVYIGVGDSVVPVENIIGVAETNGSAAAT